MRAIFDAQAMAAACLGGPARDAIEAWLDGRFELLLTHETLDELRGLCRVAGVEPGTIDEFITDIEDKAELVDYAPSGMSGSYSIMEAAVAGGAASIVSEDQRLLRLATMKLVPVVSAEHFLTVLGSGE